jgi:hypothetical protein
MTSLALAFVVLLASDAMAASGTKPPLATVVTISPELMLSFSPTSFRHGTVEIAVKNESIQAEQFEINGVNTRWIYPHRTVYMTVTFKRSMLYQASLPRCGYLSTCLD